MNSQTIGWILAAILVTVLGAWPVVATVFLVIIIISLIAGN